MNKESRTAKSLKNSSVALAFYFVNLVLQFFSRKIFLDYLGAEVLGLNTTATNLLQFLNLAELGIGSAVGFSLYKPFYDKDIQTINEIVALQGKLYQRIACVVVAGAVILMCFFPWIFDKMTLPLWYAYASFGVLLFSALLSYFVNYKQVLLSADQKEYKVQYGYKLPLLVKIVVQILAIRFLENGYVWWLVLEGGFAIIASVVLSWVIKCSYPFIQKSSLSLKSLNMKYPTIQIKIRQLFVHKVSGYVLNQTSPIIIYAFSSLTIVAIYGNYMLIILGLISLTNALSNGVTASVGNLVAEGNHRKSISVFSELFSIQFFIAMVMCFGMWMLAQPFMTLWIGKDFLLPNSTLAILVGILFVSISRRTVDSWINAYGFYSDIWAPVIEASLNVGLSVLLGYFFGLNGILMGVLISLLIVVFGWKPIFLFAINLKDGLGQYVKNYMFHLCLAGIVTVISFNLLNLLPIDPFKSVWSCFIYGIIDIIGFSILLGSAFWFSGCGIKRFLKRIRLMRNKQ